MRITKFGHACVRIEHDGQVVVIDPGAFTEREAVDGATAVLITHEHADHLDVDHLRATDAPIFTIEAVRAADRRGRPGASPSGSRSSRPASSSTSACRSPPSASCTRSSTRTCRASTTAATSSTSAAPRVYHPGDSFTPARRPGRRAPAAGARAVEQDLRGRRLRPRGRRAARRWPSTTGCSTTPGWRSSGRNLDGCCSATTATSGSSPAPTSPDRTAGPGRTVTDGAFAYRRGAPRHWDAPARGGAHRRRRRGGGVPRAATRTRPVTGVRVSRCRERVADRDELGLALGQLGLRVRVRDDPAAGEQPHRAARRSPPSAAPGPTRRRRSRPSSRPARRSGRGPCPRSR